MSDPYVTRDIARRLEQTQVTERPFTNYGAAMPAGYPINTPFFRSDLGLWIYSDGTRQLTAEQFQCDLVPYSRTPMPLAVGLGATVLIAPQRTDYASYYVRGKAYLDIVAPNDATNYWSFSLLVGSTIVWSANTSADAAGAGLQKEDTTAQVCAGAAISTGVLSKTLLPGTVILALSYWYRLIIP